MKKIPKEIKQKVYWTILDNKIIFDRDSMLDDFNNTLDMLEDEFREVKAKLKKARKRKK